jgi:hypothetical protein
LVSALGSGIVRALPRYNGDARSIAFGGRGVIVAAGSGPAAVWSTNRRSTVTASAEHADVVAARPRTGEIAVASGGRVVLADAVSPAGRELVALPADAGRVAALAFNDSGDTLAIATSEGGVAAFDVDAGFRAAPVHVGTAITSLALTGSGELWIADRDGVRSYGAADGRARRALTDTRVRGGVVIAADPSEHRLAVGTANGVLSVDLDDLSVSGPVPGDRGAVRAVAYSPDGSMFAAALATNAVALWDGGTLQPLRAPLALPRANALSFSPDGGALAALGRGGDAFIVATGLDEWRRSACDIAGRRLTRAEWERFLPGTGYDAAC